MGVIQMNQAPPRLSDLETAEPRSGLPAAEFVVSPRSTEEVAHVLSAASEERATVLIWGGGCHQGIGHPIEPRVVLDTAGLSSVIAWEPEDLTLVVEAGATVSAIEETLGERRQTALLPETTPEATVGGVVAAGISGYRRARFGPTRDRVLQVGLVTGDGRTITGGGRVVKNVSGYDLPRLVTGSFGSTGAITSVCLKLWPKPELEATVPVENAATAWRRAYRPAAVLETDRGSFAYLQGTEAEVTSQARVLGGDPDPGFRWPSPPEGDLVVSIRVPPALIGAAIARLPTGMRFVAQHGVGEVTAAVGADDAAELRPWAEHEGGSVVVMSNNGGASIDPWGADPPGLDVQRKLIAAFDPCRVLNPGRLPGRL